MPNLASLNRAIETAIITRLCAALASAGFVPAKVWDGGEYVATPDLAAVLDAVFAVDESTIHFAPTGKPDAWGRLGVFVVCGNGQDIVSDYHCGNPVFSAAIERATADDLEVR